MPTAAPSLQWKPAQPRRLRAILARLRDAYGRPVPRAHRAPIDELILTVLSQNTNDRNRDVAYTRLRERFASWAEVRDAPVAEVEEAIRPGGLAPTKAVRIQEILRAIGDDDLSWLEDAPLEEARDYLQELPGVGRKTAACVLLFAYGRPDIPVDTHVYRVGSRLGLFRPGASFNEAHDVATMRANPTTAPQDSRTDALVRRLRSDVLPAAVNGTHATVTTYETWTTSASDGTTRKPSISRAR